MPLSASPEFTVEVEALHLQLMHFARSQLRNDAWVKDTVSVGLRPGSPGRRSEV